MNVQWLKYIRHSDKVYTPLDALANRSLAFQRNLRHLLKPYLMLFLKHFQRLAHHGDKFVTRASRLQKHVCQSQVQPKLNKTTNLP
jgi:hypothetical protein